MSTRRVLSVLARFGEPDSVERYGMAQLDAVQRRTGARSDYATAPERFAHLLEVLHLQAGQRVVVLLDEYDKPILDALEKPEVARAQRATSRHSK